MSRTVGKMKDFYKIFDQISYHWDAISSNDLLQHSA
ncbi:predicted protein [Sclerotinia sclerotiorum 1980 UF-70]|uniref:Uncharacterized protein n=1 Tax=Sclerotinia sclerotiorum (strain ATCC 18683 / 1980 / Ss-1) TaxID=665079 RepID=A7ECU5_SCLS1|nr:predicted protein [Sclerotinia sclerotiorum 1980 UF-70]EDO00661.1 predicted protein [Sclerotinia sclerotiorum 1980 UF-70]